MRLLQDSMWACMDGGGSGVNLSTTRRSWCLNSVADVPADQMDTDPQDAEECGEGFAPDRVSPESALGAG